MMLYVYKYSSLICFLVSCFSFYFLCPREYKNFCYKNPEILHLINNIYKCHENFSFDYSNAEDFETIVKPEIFLIANSANKKESSKKLTKKISITINKNIKQSISNLPKNLRNEIIKLSSFILKNDKIEVLYDYFESNGKEKFNQLIAMRVINRKLSVYYYPKKKKFFNYLGQTPGKEILRKPLDYRRAKITSPFSQRRLHPLKKIYRPHNGVDYSAPPGTKILAAADGVIIKAAYDRGYGNVVVVKHSNGFETLYAHMQRIPKDIRVFNHIKQGQKIGTVGSTGLSTSPHLHFGMRNTKGSYVNPLGNSFSNIETLNKKDMQEFKKIVKNANSLFNK